MKKIIFIIAIVFVLASCDTDPTGKEINPLIGIWEDSNVNFTETFEFSETTVIAIYQSLQPAISEPYIQRGTYQIYDTVIIFRLDEGGKFFADYTITGKELTLTFSHNGNTAKYQKK